MFATFLMAVWSFFAAPVLAHASYVTDSYEESPVGVDLFVSLAEGSWWRTSFATQHSSSPLQISVTLKSSTGCSEGAATDGTCMFGLKLYGSKHGPPTADDYEQHDEGSHHAGEEYRLLVPACSLQNAGRYYIGLRGWDGTNQIKLRADEGAPHCPPIAPYPPPTADPVWRAGRRGAQSAFRSASRSARRSATTRRPPRPLCRATRTARRCCTIR